MAKTNQYSYKPYKIGAVIKQIMAEKQLDKKVIAQQLGITLRAFELWYDREYLPMEEMLQLSELIDYNLVHEYHPNVKPLPNPLQAQLDEARDQLRELDILKRETAMLKTKNNRLEGENDIMLRLLEKK
jgi:hypothetical protein